MSRIPPANRQIVFDRDGNRCQYCGESYDLTIQHRINRKMGGSKLHDGFANLTTLCWGCNMRAESDLRKAMVNAGLKVASWEAVETVPVVDWAGARWILHDDGTRTQLGGWAP